MCLPLLASSSSSSPSSKKHDDNDIDYDKFDYGEYTEEYYREKFPGFDDWKSTRSFTTPTSLSLLTADDAV